MSCHVARSVSRGPSSHNITYPESMLRVHWAAGLADSEGANHGQLLHRGRIRFVPGCGKGLRVLFLAVFGTQAFAEWKDERTCSCDLD